jgi:hypothetical protein
MRSDGKCRGMASNLSIDCTWRRGAGRMADGRCHEPERPTPSGEAALLRRGDRVEVDVGELGA